MGCYFREIASRRNRAFGSDYDVVGYYKNAETNGKAIRYDITSFRVYVRIQAAVAVYHHD
ncbi:hypothetical protein KCP77_22410 [Salmonella enterica subsp. enterica]|nr:hypothetical protein KCP77_22410 [Salmonella enterica subsp. enterica]